MATRHNRSAQSEVVGWDSRSPDSRDSCTSARSPPWTASPSVGHQERMTEVYDQGSSKAEPANAITIRRRGRPSISIQMKQAMSDVVRARRACSSTTTSALIEGTGTTIRRDDPRRHQDRIQARRDARKSSGRISWRSYPNQATAAAAYKDAPSIRSSSISAHARDSSR